MIEMVTDCAGYIPGPVNIGLYIFQAGRCLLIDTGLDDKTAKSAYKDIVGRGLVLETILITHSHADHTGGAAWLQSKIGCKMYASQWEAAILANPLLEPFYLYTAHPIRELQSKFFLAKACQEVTVISPGNIFADIEMIDLKGHSPGQLGFMTPDRVFYVADSYFSETVLDKYYIPYFADIGQTIATLHRIVNTDASYFLPAHGNLTQDIRGVVEANKNRIKEIFGDIRRFLEGPGLSKEEIIQLFIQERSIGLSIGQYYLTSASISAFLTYMQEQGEIEFYVKDSNLKAKLCE